MTFNVEDTVWFIDNTAPGSLNLGTQDNPFTSIAAFNAVNDGVGNHPAAGDIVYLRAGTYTEADGINLLNNQTLIGQGENLVVNHSLGGNITLETGSVGQTPVIIVTGAGNQGIQLAQGNTISGLDVGMNNATAVGIADGGGTVGNLTISNVGVGVGSNLGSAVDIDQGGTLNVTLEDSLSSSGSAGQGVQLAANGAALTGTFSATAGSISGSTGTAFQVGTGDAGAAGTGGVAAISYGGVIASTGAVRAVEIEDRAASAGAINLSGNITQTTGTASGIVLDDNVAGNITFSGAANTLASTTATELASPTRPAAR